MCESFLDYLNSYLWTQLHALASGSSGLSTSSINFRAIRLTSQLFHKYYFGSIIFPTILTLPTQIIQLKFNLLTFFTTLFILSHFSCSKPFCHILYHWHRHHRSTTTNYSLRNTQLFFNSTPRQPHLFLLSDHETVNFVRHSVHTTPFIFSFRPLGRAAMLASKEAGFRKLYQII